MQYSNTKPRKCGQILYVSEWLFSYFLLLFDWFFSRRLWHDWECGTHECSNRWIAMYCINVNKMSRWFYCLTRWSTICDGAISTRSNGNLFWFVISYSTVISVSINIRINGASMMLLHRSTRLVYSLMLPYSTESFMFVGGWDADENTLNSDKKWVNFFSLQTNEIFAYVGIVPIILIVYRFLQIADLFSVYYAQIDFSLFSQIRCPT